MLLFFRSEVSRLGYTYPAVAAVIVLDDFVEFFFGEIAVYVILHISLKVSLEFTLLCFQPALVCGFTDLQMNFTSFMIHRKGR